MKYSLVITGRPGIGKSTLFNKIIQSIKENGLKVSGIITLEERDSSGQRVGFKIIDLSSGEWAWLARKDYYSSIRVGSYGVIVDESSRIIRRALDKGVVLNSDVIGIDEIGPMELKIPVFKPLLLEALKTGKPLIAVVHYRLSDPEILGLLENSEKVVITLENRDILMDQLPKKVAGDLLKKVRGAGK
ncbi:NTPase [Thermogladius sp. 4427co]|uniref:NTPase n=1 Tax=Thermogladius sp. 4427co TaxID=3450718 RepID=UPI003F79D6C1